MKKSYKLIMAAVLSIAVALGLGLSPAHAAGPDAGLYGTTDPTYTGVDNQALAILGLDSVGVSADRAAVKWLVAQQCLDGSFESYRVSIRTACGPPDAVNYTGPNTNATALAALALNASGKIAQAQRAVEWLTKATAVAPNGKTGIAYYPGSGALPDTNSSGLAYAAMSGLGVNSAVVRQVRAYLLSAITPCAQSGGAKFQVSEAGVNNSASAQALFGLAALTPAEPANKLGASPKCAKNKAKNKVKNLASYLSGQLKTGVLSSFPYDGDDFGNTAATVVTFNTMKVGKKPVGKATAALKKNAKTWALKDGKVNAGALGWLLMVAQATDSNPKKFGGVNLISTLTKSMKK
ncbi:MAG: hypothetical protein HQ468_02535 [Actinomycetales bacterium]|nr:hypothetical protein [Actinomycetales bacterium]